ncbi:MAG: L,D-transpeptidase family protein [Pseudomonadota bacterium]
MTKLRSEGHRRLAYVRRAASFGPQGHLGHFILAGEVHPCALGRSGLSALKREGDWATPIGLLSLVSGRYRADHVHRPPGSASFWTQIKIQDGWCDAPFTPLYNRKVSLPFSASHERMLRDDRLYDRVIVLDWNYYTRAQGRGSAIFLHQARESEACRTPCGAPFKPTEGCIALKREDFRRLLPKLALIDAILVVA